MIRKHKTFSFHYSTSTSFSGLFFSPGNLHTATLQVACTDHRCTRRLNSAGVLVRRLAAGGWVRLCEACYCMPRMPNAYPLLVRVLVSITAKPEHNPLIPGMTHAQSINQSIFTHIRTRDDGPSKSSFLRSMHGMVPYAMVSLRLVRSLPV